ncbi:hypothetical protein P885DRAFT_25496 [Corynascus similis CBS 632.67]
MSQPACCTCASLLVAVPRVSSTSEKPLPNERQLSCCGRIICGACIHNNPRFQSYCPYCQTSSASPVGSRLKTRRRRSEAESGSDSESNPPPYSAIAQTIDIKLNTSEPTNSPPPYSPSFTSLPSLSQPTPLKQAFPIDGEEAAPSGYTIHHLRHPPHPQPDTLASLSLRYGIPLSVLRRHNNLPNDADYLLAARHTLLIPTAYITIANKNSNKDNDSSAVAGEVSLSPHPVEDAAERERKIVIRRFMVACKESDYDTAVVYLEESGYDFGEAVARHREDAEWERRNPLEASRRKGKGKGKTRRNLLLKEDEGGTGGSGGGSLLGWLKR